MAVRIFTLAKELQMSSKDLIAFLATQGHPASSHMANIPDSVAAILRDRLKPKLPKPPPPRPEAKPGMAARPTVPATRSQPGDVAARQGVAAGPTAPRRDAFAPPGRRVEGIGGGRPAPPGAPRAAAGVEGWEKKKDDKEGEDKDKEKDKSKEVPTKKRYFPTREDLYEMGPRFGARGRRPRAGPRPRRDGPGEAAVATTERPAKIAVALPITVKDLSAAMGIKGAAIIKALMENGHPVQINQFLDEELVMTVAVQFNTEIEFKKKEATLEETTKKIESYESKPEDLVPRAPVVTFLGHVDHGKTSLLDKIRSTNVAVKEAGGITQHLGAYRVDSGDVHVVFIDTPGHQAFTAMRARGANVTDVAVLVVAADDGVMPQTEEALNHARAAGVQIVVALNKIDKPTANAMRVKQQLAALGLQPVEWGGDTEVIEVSALTSKGIDILLQTLSLTSELKELKADPQRPAIGIILEAEASSSRGVVATVLIREGTLHLGDYVLCGSTHGRIRGMFLNGVTPIREAGPSTPVKVTGLELVPEAGEKLYVFEDVQQAREIAADRFRKRREIEIAESQKVQVTLENLLSTLKKDASQELRIILRADYKGSVEALRSAIENLSTSEVKVRMLHAGVGAITQEDIMLATASQDANAVVIGFNVAADERARNLAEEKKVEIRTYDVIYKVTDDIKAALEARLAPQLHEEVHGHAEIRKVFKASKVGNIAGCLVTDGFIARSDQIRLVRDGRIVHTGTLSSLKRVKDDAREVKAGFECGLKVASYEDIKEADVIEAFAIVEKPRQL